MTSSTLSAPRTVTSTPVFRQRSTVTPWRPKQGRSRFSKLCLGNNNVTLWLQMLNALLTVISGAAQRCRGVARGWRHATTWHHAVKLRCAVKWLVVTWLARKLLWRHQVALHWWRTSKIFNYKTTAAMIIIFETSLLHVLVLVLVLAKLTANSVNAVLLFCDGTPFAWTNSLMVKYNVVHQLNSGYCKAVLMWAKGTDWINCMLAMASN